MFSAKRADKVHNAVGSSYKKHEIYRVIGCIKRQKVRKDLSFIIKLFNILSIVDFKRFPFHV